MQIITNQNFRIVGSGSYLPERIVTAAEMDVRCGLEAGWCEKQVGVLRRHECVAPETMVSMASRAIELAMADAGIGWDDTDMLIDCSTSQFRPIPCNAAHYANSLGKDISHQSISGIPCFDIHSTCLSSLVAMNMVNSMMATGQYRYIVLVSSESGLGGVNYTEAESACLIGDGAAALVLGYVPSSQLLGFTHKTLADHLEACHVDGGGHKRSVFEYSRDQDAFYRFTMDGPNVFRIALKHLKPMVDKLLLEWNPASSGNYNGLHIVPHQASPRALQTVKRLFRSDDEHFHVAVHEIGNMVAASLPTMLDRVRKEHRIQPGEPVIAMGTSAGYSQAAMMFHL